MPNIQHTYCEVCQTKTRHRDGECIDCVIDHYERITGRWVRDDEERAWSRTKRKCLTIVTSTICIIGICMVLAQHPSGDDLVQGLITSLIAGIGVWFGTSKKNAQRSTSDDLNSSTIDY